MATFRGLRQLAANLDAQYEVVNEADEELLVRSGVG